MENSIPDQQIQPLNDFVARALGLHFPTSRQSDLKRGVVAAAQELGFEDTIEFIQLLLSAQATQIHLDALATHLTVGETYFFRQSHCHDLLIRHFIPTLARSRHARAKRLRIWSAGCCTGEEPYSIAMTVAQRLADWREWDIAILATDLNPAFLRKAQAGLYGSWSFRNAPAGVQRKFFVASADGRFEILPEIRRMVRFAQLNLAEDIYPSPANDTDSMDVIFCQNVLMYFTLSQTKKVVQRFWRAQARDGILLVSPTEMPDLLCPGYQSVHQDGAIYYQKRQAPIAPPRPIITAPPAVEYVRPPAAAKKPRSPIPQVATPVEPKHFSSLARSLADQGKLGLALECCDQWIVADNLNPAGHYLRSVILQEQDSMESAMQSLVKAIYLDPGFSVAHFALGNITRTCGRRREANRHLNNALSSLRQFHPTDILPESDGVTAGRLAEIINKLQELQVAA